MIVKTTAALAGFLFCAGSAAAQIDSTYTRTDTDGACRVVEESDPDEGGFYQWVACGGVGGWTLHIDGGEHAQRTGYTRGGTAPVFHQPQVRGNFGSFHSVVEWRLVSESPTATIHRYYSNIPLDDGSWGRGETLVVTTLTGLGGTEVCPVAYVNAMMAGGNEIARDAADLLARDFVCGEDEIYRLSGARPGEARQIAAGHGIDVAAVLANRRQP